MEGIVLGPIFVYPFGNIGFFLMGYAIFFQFVAHLLIALNRYSVITLTRDEVSYRTGQFDV